MWAAIAGIAHVAAVAFGSGFYPAWFFFLTSVAYGLMLPVIARYAATSHARPNEVIPTSRTCRMSRLSASELSGRTRSGLSSPRT